MMTEKRGEGEMKLGPVVFAAITIMVAAVAYLLKVAQDVFMPMAIAVAVWYLLVSMASGARKLPGVGRYFPLWVAYIAVTALTLLVLVVVFDILHSNISRFLAAAPEYQDKVASLIYGALRALGEESPPDLSETLDRFDLVAITGFLGGLLTSLAENAAVIGIYVVFLLLEQSSFDKKLAALVKDEGQLGNARRIIQTISSQIQVYLRVKTLLSGATAGICYLILLGVGLDFPEFWALLIFLLNYIPTIGSIVSTTIPCLLALVQFQTWPPIVITILGLTAVQISVGNILEPRLMGSTFNLSGLVIVFSLAIWGKMWGVVGMVLCVPIMVIANIIFSHFPATRPLAILFSAEGQVRPPTADDELD